jgi:membrane dipeptidase
MTTFSRSIPAAATALALALCACATVPAAPEPPTPSPAMSDVRALHERLITLDTHLDTPILFSRPGWSILDRHDARQDYSQVDLPRMKEGGLDGGFWVIYTAQGPRDADANAVARDFALRRGIEIREMVARHGEYFAIALKAEDAAPIAASGKRVVYISLENAYPLGRDISLLKTFYDMGVRMAGPVHFANNDLADSATDPKGPEHGGLSKLGEAFVKEANRLGIVIDASHASDGSFDDMLAQSSAPIILSHSGVDAVYDHPRNIDDARLKALAAKGGVIQMNSLGAYLVALPPAPAERAKAVQALRDQKLTDAIALLQARRRIDAQFPAPQAQFEDFMKHVIHALKLVGPDHVGIGADWDGGGGVLGMEDVAAFPKITERLLAEGYTETDLAKIWSGNVLRVLAAAEAEAARIAKTEP